MTCASPCAAQLQETQLYVIVNTLDFGLGFSVLLCHFLFIAYLYRFSHTIKIQIFFSTEKIEKFIEIF